MVNPTSLQQQSLSEILFSQMPMGLAIFDQNLKLRRFNSTWAEITGQLSPIQADSVADDQFLPTLLPEGKAALIPLFESVIDGALVRQETLRLESRGITCYWDVTLVPLTKKNGDFTIICGVIDITKRVLAQKELEQRVEARSQELQALLTMYRHVVSLETDPFLDLILKQLQVVVDYTAAAIMTVDEEQLVIQAFRGPTPEQAVIGQRIPLDNIPVWKEIIESRQPVTIKDIRGGTGGIPAFSQLLNDHFADIYAYTRAWMGVPLVAPGGAIGILNLFHNQPNYYMSYHAELALAFAHHVAVALESERSYEQVRQLATLTERDRLARSLHDRLAQALGYINIKASLIDQLLSEKQIDPARASLEELKTVAIDTYADVREAIFNLRTKVHGGSEFLPMLREYLVEYETQHSIKTRIQIDSDRAGEFPAVVGTQVIRVIQEALSNVRKHAQATQVTIRFVATNGQIRLTIRDNGRGFEVERIRQQNRFSFGLDIMRERIESVGGRLEISSAPGRGTTVTLYVPQSREG